MWLKWYNFMASKYPQAYWTMMNYGYAPVASGQQQRTQSLELSAAEEWERYSVQMYHHVASAAGHVPAATGLGGLDVLEVGCGRGGGLAWLARGGSGNGGQHATQPSQRPKSAVGLDFSPVQIEFCRRRYRLKGVSRRFHLVT